MVERDPVKIEVGGSNPPGGAYKFYSNLWYNPLDSFYGNNHHTATYSFKWYICHG